MNAVELHVLGYDILTFFLTQVPGILVVKLPRKLSEVYLDIPPSYPRPSCHFIRRMFKAIAAQLASSCPAEVRVGCLGTA